MTETVRRRLLFSGDVQGVGFRYWAVREASAFDVSGYVRNLTEGRVEVVVEGPRGEVEGLSALLRGGPPYGRVRHVEAIVEQPRGEFESFQVKY